MKNLENKIRELMDSIGKYGLVKSVSSLCPPQTKLNISYSESTCLAPIEELALSVRGYNCLKRSGINTIGELIEMINSQKLPSVRNLGIKTVSEIKATLLQYGYDKYDDEEKKLFLKNIADCIR